MSPLIQYRRYRSPLQDGEKFLDPPWLEAIQLVTANIQRRRDYQIEIGGWQLTRLVAEARSQLCQLAANFTRQYRDLDADPSAESPFVLAGHQPKLFHPGILFKDFVLHSIAEKTRAVAIHLIIDNDLAGATAIRVPSGSVLQPRIENVAYDQAAADIPFEERQVIDRSTFDSFGDRVLQLTGSLGLNPLLNEWWPRVIAGSKHRSNLGQCIALGAHQLESDWGANTLHVPLSSLCNTNSFRRFVLHLLADLPRFLGIYNDCLLEYRRVNRVRSRSHPVPALEKSTDGWLEAPLWIWTQNDPRRRRLFVRRQGSQWELTDRGKQRCYLPNANGEFSDSQLDVYDQMEDDGIKIRPRALITTMYARLVLSDLFVHGIGGGKYDQLTDAIMKRWLEFEPPSFLVATATARLPVDRPGVHEADLNRVDRQLRDLTFNPDRYLDGRVDTSALVAEKRALVATETMQGAGRERHNAITRTNKSLQPFVANLRTDLVAERDSLIESLRRERILGSREFAFCLFPEPTLRSLLLDNG